MATSWKPPILGGRPTRTAPPGTEPAPSGPSTPGPGAPAARPSPTVAARPWTPPKAIPPQAAPAAGSPPPPEAKYPEAKLPEAKLPEAKPPATRRAPLPSLAELGAFDGVSGPPPPRRSGRLSEEDLRGLSRPAKVPPPPGAAAPHVEPAEPVRPAAVPARPLPAAAPSQTPRAAEPARLRPDADPRAQAEARAQEQALARAREQALAAARQAEVARRAAMQGQAERAARPAGPIAPPLTSREPLARAAMPPATAPATRPSAPGQEAAPRKTVPAFNVAWADLDAAVQAGWIRKEAAHALWARWLARKPLTHTEDDGGPQAPLPPLPTSPEQADAQAASGPPAAPDERPLPPSPPVAASPESSAPAAPAAPAAPTAAPAPVSGPSPAPSPAPSPVPPPPAAAASAAPPAAAAQAPAPSSAPVQEPAGARPPAQAVRPPAASVPPDPSAEPPTAADPSPAPQASEAVPPAPPPAAQPEVIDVEVLEPLEDAQARRAAERAAQPAPVIQVTDVIQALPAKSARPPAPRWIVGQTLIAMLAGVVAAVSAGLGHVLFGPAGAALAAGFWAAVAWRKTVRFQAEGQEVRALLGAHLVLPLLAIAVWQLQEAAGWWPPAKPLDMFADPPLDTLARAAPGLRLDWRWMALAGVPLAAAVYWLIQLRRPAMLAVVITLLWLVTFQAVAGVLQAMGLAFHGMTVFMLLLGGMTLLGGFYIDLKARPAGLADFARWPYLCGAALLGAGWLSLSVVPGPLALARYAAWLFFLVAALSVSRPSLVALALAIAGLELALGVGATAGSSLVTGGVWLVWLTLVAGLLVWMFPRAHGWSRRWQFWMPRAWRDALAQPPG